MAEAGVIHAPLLGPDDPDPVGIRNDVARSPFLLICDHAGNAVPASLDRLGLARTDLERHIGIDVGILPVSERISDLIGAPLVYQRYSRLVVECNRKRAAPDLIALISDGTPVPGNIGIGEAERDRRIREIAEPYHQEVSARLAGRDAEVPVVLISMHSFTPSLRSKPFARPWHLGLCYGRNDAFSRCVLAVLDDESDLVVGRNQPYSVDVERDYSVPVYGEERGHPYVEFEIRQDLIAEAADQQRWAGQIVDVLRKAHALFERGGP
jgi:predicted N-formylglutamate amidohydrolase